MSKNVNVNGKKLSDTPTIANDSTVRYHAVTLIQVLAMPIRPIYGQSAVNKRLFLHSTCQLLWDFNVNYAHATNNINSH